MLPILFALLPLAACQTLVGGPVAVDVNRDDIKQMATFALGELNTLLGSQNTLVKVVSAKTQVVAGTNYMMVLQLQEGGATTTCSVTVWSRPWIHDKRLTSHTCSAKKRQVMPGGHMSIDVNREDVQNMASFALSEVNQLTGTQNKLEEVVSAETQVVAGINYFLTIRINDGTNSKTCHVTVFYQAWTNTKKVSHQTCGSRRRDSVMPGGLTTADVNSAEIQQMANFALTQINGLQGTQNTLTEVISAKTQVVAGMNYILTLRLNKDSESQICTVKIWSQPWLHKQALTEHRCAKVAKRAGGLLGGASYVDVTSPEVAKMASFAVSELNGLQGAQNSLVKVISARQQVVAGMNYFLKLSLKNGDKTQICDVKVWYQSWTETTKLLTQHCTGAKRAVFGGVEPASLSEPVQKAVTFAEDALNAKSNNLFRLVTEKVDNITRQIVAGIKYTFDLHLVTSSCRNEDASRGKTIADCPANTNGAQRQTCTVSVMYQAWSKPQYQLLSDSCGQLS